MSSERNLHPQVKTRPVTDEDAASIARLLGVMGYPSSSDDVITRLLAVRGRSNFAVWVADVGGVVVGLVGASVDPYLEENGLYGRIVVLVVAPDDQRQGVGHTLI